MVIQPKVRGFICTTAHPVGCHEHVRQQIRYIQNQPSIEGPKKVLVIGASTGYGLASRITAAFGAKAATIGVFFEKPSSDNRTATAGWYNTAAFEEEAHAAGLYAKSINGDAFSDEIKQQTIDMIRNDLGQVDLVVYSLASPRRTHPKTGESFASVIKPVGKAYSNKTVNFHTGVVSDVTIEPATEDEVRQTIAVMGGEDWEFWMKDLQDAGVLAPGANTVAYSYIGPDVTRPIYRDGTIGQAKNDLEAAARRVSGWLSKTGGHALVSVNKAVVTQSSSAIPIVPLYISLLFKVMKEQGLHEDCIEQMYRLFADRLYVGGEIPTDEAGRVRLDDWEMKPAVQNAVADKWNNLDSENILSVTDLTGYRTDFMHLFGFELPNVDYDADVNPEVSIRSIP